MRIRRGWAWLTGRVAVHRRGTGGDPRAVDAILDRTFHEVCDIDPQTTARWRHLESAMHREQGIAEHRSWVAARRPARVAVAIAAAAVAGIIMLVLWPRDTPPVTYQTGKGQVSTIILRDSSEVVLNHTSELIVERPSSGALRRVVLKGEALFRIHRDGMPFLVSTDIAAVLVTGTEFNVRVRGDRMEVGVLSGTVNVAARHGGKDSTVVLAPGQLTTCQAAEFPDAPAPLTLPGYPGWIHGTLTFYRTAMAGVCAEIESKFDVAIRIEDPRLRDESITGTLDAGSAEKAVSTLAKLTGSDYRHENSAYILY